MNCLEYRTAVFNHDADPYELDRHVESCIDCVRWQEEQMDAEDKARGVVTAVPIPGEAASAIEHEAADRLSKAHNGDGEDLELHGGRVPSGVHG